MKKIIITEKESNQRVDKFIKKFFSNAPLSFIYKLFRKKDIKINGHWVKENYIVQAGDELSIYVSDVQMNDFVTIKKIEKLPFNHQIIYEDENILIVNKPRGLLVHGDDNEKRITLQNEVLSYLYSKDEFNPAIDKAFMPAPAHRLDRNTSGLIIFGKNLDSLHELENLFCEKNEVNKTYLALVFGKINQKMQLNYPLKKDEKTGIVKVTSISNGGKTAFSIVDPIKYTDKYSLVHVKIITGRTHQIRVHLSYAGFPIIGDTKYGDFIKNKEFKKMYCFENQFLHAESIEFGKIGGKLSYLSNKKFIANLPEKEKQILIDLNIL